MSRTFFVGSDTVKLPLFDEGQYWVEVKQQLSAGEAKKLSQGAFSRMVQAGTPAEPSLAWDLNFEAAAFLKVELYLLDWNLTDASGKTVEINTPKTKHDALKALRPDAFAEIERVIDEHALAQSKNAPSGVTTQTTTTL